MKNETLAKVAAKMELHKHLLYLAPKLQTSIDKFLKILDDGLEENDLNTEEDEVNSEVRQLDVHLVKKYDQS